MPVSTLATLSVLGLALAGSLQEASITSGRVELPQDGAKSTRAYAVVKNPTMYDVYLTSASSSIAGAVEFRKASDGEETKVSELTVPAYGTLTMKPDGAYLLLVDLTESLTENDTVTITITTDASAKLRVEAVVGKE
jgi:copper(I)-binding protein